MLIDWFTVGAQALNFLVLVWLMKRFLYQPILNAIDAREQNIAAKLAQAKAQQAQAQQERDAFAHKNEAFAKVRDDLLNKAREQAKAEHDKLLKAANEAAEALRAQQQQALQTDARNLTHTLAHRIQHEVFGISRKALTELADTSLNAHMCTVFIQHVQALPAPEKACCVLHWAAQTNPC